MRLLVILPRDFRKFLCDTRSAALDDELLAAAIQSDAGRYFHVAIAAFHLRMLANIQPANDTPTVQDTVVNEPVRAVVGLFVGEITGR